MKQFNPLNKQVWAICVLFIVTTVNAQHGNYPSKKNYQLVIGGTTGLIKPKGNQFEPAGIRGINLGFATQAWISNKYSVWFGITYAFLKIGNYNNTTIYSSEWISGMYSQEISLLSTIKQQSIQIPVFINRNLGRFFVGGGVSINYLTTTYFSQEVQGSYAPHPNHPNAFTNYNKTIQIVYNRSEFNTAPFQKVNLTPAIQLGYQMKKRAAAQLSTGYVLLSNPPYTNIPFNPYRQLLFSLSLTYKTN